MNPQNPLNLVPPDNLPKDEDLVQQANPGHGIPSQDPDSLAQTPLESEHVEREANSVLIGGGVVAGAATGAAIGIAVGGPVGVLVGATMGAVAGAIGGAAGGTLGNPSDATEPDTASDNTVRLHINDSGGCGRPVVLIHGWPLSGQAWQPQVPALREAGYRVVTYDRRGFGHSDKPQAGYDFDTLADDLQRVLDQCNLKDVTLVGFSMGGGEVARYVARHGESRLRSVVFAAAVPPCLMKSTDNPDGPLTPEKAQEKKQSLALDSSDYFAQFTQNFFSANGVLQVSEAEREEAVTLCFQSARHSALACMDAFSTTDFRGDLKKLTVPTLVIHGDADAILPIEGSGLRTHLAVAHSQLVTVSGAPHGLNVSHALVFNDALLNFLKD